MKIKNHKILHEINRGSLTTVYKAKHLNLDRFVLLKVLNSQWLQEVDLLERFRREARISAKIDHPNIVRVYDFEVSSELVYISLEFVDGQTLQQFIEKEHPAPMDRAMAIIRDVLTALAYTHERGILHRDIKPANIMIDSLGRARLTDFGLACLDDIPAITEQGQSMGTPAFMAPEIVQGAQGTIRSDLFSAGVTVYELLTGKSPFQRENMAATLHAVISEDAPAIATLRSDVQPEIERLVCELMQKNVDDRPENANIILEKLLHTEPTLVDDTASATSVKKSRWPVASLITSLLLVMAIYFWPKQTNLVEPAGNAIPDSVSVNEPGRFIEAPNDSIKTSPIALFKNPSDKRPESIDSNILALPEQAKSFTAILALPEQAKSFTAINSADAAVVNGYFYAACKPWAQIIIDGDTVDTTPMTMPLPLSPGIHQVELFNPNYKLHRLTIESRSGVTDTINVQLEATYGYLTVRVVPWAQVFIDGEYKEDTPLSRPLILTSGMHILKVANPNFGEITDSIYIELDKTLEKQFTLKPRN